MTTKVQRQSVIVRLVGEHEVTSQPELIELLATKGIDADCFVVSTVVTGPAKHRIDSYSR